MAELLPSHLQQRADAEFGAAWRRCETALPDGWMLELVRWGAVSPEQNPATGYPVRYPTRYRAIAQPMWPPSADAIECDGDSPANALTALAEALESR